MIFGYKQQGKAAANARNVFFHLTYENQVNWANIDKDERMAIETQITHFGQIPKMLLKKHHTRRYNDEEYWKEINCCLYSLSDPRAATKVFRKKKAEDAGNFIRKYTNFAEWPEASVLMIKSFSNNKILVVKKEIIEIFHFNHRLGVLKTSGKIPFEFAKVKDRKYSPYKLTNAKLNWIDCSHKVLKGCTECINNGKRIYYGGYFDGKILVYKWESKTTETYNQHADTVTCLAIDHEEYYLASGSRSGQVILWKILGDDQSRSLQVEKSWIDHDDEITGIHITYDSRLLTTCSLDTKANIYNMITGEKIRTFYHPNNLPLTRALVSLYPIATIVLYSDIDQTFWIYSVNGQLLVSEKIIGTSIYDCCISHDANCIDVLSYSNDQGVVVIVKMPYFEGQSMYKASKNGPVTALCIFPGTDAILCGELLGDVHIMIDDSPKEKFKLF